MSDDNPSPHPPPPPAPQAPPNVMQSVTLEMSPNLEAVYANFSVISHTPSEVLLDFARALPNTKARVYSRVLMTPLNAKMFLRALADNLARYEAQFGEIVVPTHLADQLFRPRPDGQ